MSSDTESHLSPGTVVARRYRVDRVIGSGGFAVVYRAHHLSLDAPVALKVLRLGIGDSAERRERELERFVEEARILARFRHPGIVGVIDAGIEASAAMAAPFPWMALEWCEGATLAAEVGRRRGVALSPQEAWWIVRAVALAVGEAHAAGVVHRDLKPANVMLVRGKEGVEPRVLDFGIAKVIEASKLESDAATQGTLVCSPAYAAPEQVVGGVTGPWTDIHALGIIMTELLCCRAPYDVTGAGPIAALRPTPAAHGVDVGALEPVLSRAVALTPGDRFDDVASFIAAVDEAVGPPAPVHLSTPPSGPEPRSSPSTGRAGPAGRWSGPPAGGTERTAGARAPFDASSGVQRGSGRAYLGIAVGALLGFVLGAVATRLVASPPSAAPSSAATAASPSVAAPAPTAAPRAAPAATRLSELDATALEARIVAAGRTIRSTGSVRETETVSHVTLDDPSGTASVYLVSFDPAKVALSGNELERYLLRRVALVHADGVAFAIDGSRALVVVAPGEEAALTLRAAVLRGLDAAVVSQRGARIDVPRAARLAELEYDELIARIRRTGAEVDQSSQGIESSYNFVMRRGMLRVRGFFWRRGGPKSLAALTQLSERAGLYAYASDGEVAIAFQGTRADLGGLPAEVLEGLGASITPPSR